MFQRALIRDRDVEPLADGVCGVLDRVGILCQSEEILRALREAGAAVDFQGERVRFPRKMVQAFADSLRAGGTQNVAFELFGAPSDGRAADASPSADTESPRFAEPAPPELGTQVAQLYYDYESRERRSGNRRDLITLIQLADTLHPASRAGHALVQAEVHPKMEALETALLLAEYAHKPGAAFAWYADQVDYLREMGEIMGMKDWFSWGSACFAHPLRLDRNDALKLVRRVREGVPTGLTGMPIAGITTPATLEGFIAVSCAEHMAMWMIVRALDPHVRLSGSMWAGTVDMRSGAVSYSSFDSMRYGLAAVEFLRRWTGISIPVGGGEYCDAREPGLYAALEKAYKAMTLAAFTGIHPGIGEGMLESGKTLAPVQLMLERDLHGGLAHFARTAAPTPENIGLDAIAEVGLGYDLNHIATAHTLRHFRSALWLPDLLDRSGWNGAATDRELLDKAQSRMRGLLAQYRKPEGREDQLVRMRQVVERARPTLSR